MRKKPVHVRVRHEPSEEVIRDYAQHLYEQSGRIPGRDLDNWYEAKACLEANIPHQPSHMRLQSDLAERESREACEAPIEARNVAS
jgi:ferritin-like protein